MSEFNFDEFNKNFDLEGLKKDISEAENNTIDYQEVPVGQYEVSIERLEIKSSKKGLPMFTCWMKIVAGEYKGQLLFMNQVITKGFQIHIVNEFLRSLGAEMEIHFDDFRQYNDLILDIHEYIKEQKLEYAVDFTKKNDFNNYRITEVFETE